MTETHSRDEVLKTLELLSGKYVGRRSFSFSEAASVNHDFRIGGDDADEFLGEVQAKFGTRFEGLDWEDYFKEEVSFEGVEHFLGFNDIVRKDLTVGHLADVIQRGAWFEPEVPRYRSAFSPKVYDAMPAQPRLSGQGLLLWIGVAVAIVALIAVVSRTMAA